MEGDLAEGENIGKKERVEGEEKDSWGKRLIKIVMLVHSLGRSLKPRFSLFCLGPKSKLLIYSIAGHLVALSNIEISYDKFVQL